MAGRGPQSFQKRQKEQKRKEKQDEKRAKRVQRRTEKGDELPDDGIDYSAAAQEDDFLDRLVIDEDGNLVQPGKRSDSSETV